MITADQVKAARKLLGWMQEEVAAQARVSKTAVAAVERGDRTSDWIIDAIQDALEGAGVEFPEGEPVRLRKSK